MTVLYITQNGVTDHIGRSQVAPYVLGLARMGFQIHVLSAEKPDRQALIEEYQRQFDSAGVRWTHVLYRNKPSLLGQVWTQVLMQRMARRIVQAGGVRLIHSRSFPPALIAYRLKQEFGLKYIFDFRDFYADWGLDHTRGIKRMIYRRLKQLEGSMIRAASKVVCLTERATGVLSESYLKDRPNARNVFKVIPCCADFSHFDRVQVSDEGIVKVRSELGIAPGEFVLLYLGSLGTDYLLDHMIALFRQVLTFHGQACFLFVSNNGDEIINRACRDQGVNTSRIRFVTVGRESVPLYICLANLSVVFIRADHTKVGCSPTKIAELFACEVPVIANSGVGDLDDFISPQVNGSLLVSDFEDATLLRAVKKMAELTKIPRVEIRKNSRQFSLEVGVARYADVYRELLAQ